MSDEANGDAMQTSSAKETLDLAHQPHWLMPDWPAPESVQALVTTRESGPSEGAFAHFNPADHVGDAPSSVAECRRWLSHCVGDERPLLWMDQVHGTGVVESPQSIGQPPQADASVAFDQSHACVVMTADCLPVFLCDRQGTRVGLAHAGWRGLLNGVIEATVARLDCAPHELMAWLGPAISSELFEVGPEVFEAFIADNPQDEKAFKHSPYRLKHYMADLYELARLRLQRMGIRQVYGGNLCTASDSRFFSYRRDNGHTGRMASMIWLKH